MDYSITPTRLVGRIDYRLDAEHLRARWAQSGRDVVIPYAAIDTIEIRRPMPRLMTTRVLGGVGVIVIESLEVSGFGGKVNHTREYVGFVRALVDRLAQRGTNVRVIVGSSMVWWIGLAHGAFTALLTIIALVGIAFGGVVLAPGLLGIPVVYLPRRGERASEQLDGERLPVGERPASVTLPLRDHRLLVGAGLRHEEIVVAGAE